MTTVNSPEIVVLSDNQNGNKYLGIATVEDPAILTLAMNDKGVIVNTAGRYCIEPNNPGVNSGAVMRRRGPMKRLNLLGWRCRRFLNCSRREVSIGAFEFQTLREMVPLEEKAGKLADDGQWEGTAALLTQFVAAKAKKALADTARMTKKILR